MTESSHSDPRLEQARELVMLLEAGETEKADQVLHELAGGAESPIFQEVGRLTRELHDAINEFLQDERLHQMADHEIKDAAERLRYVITMTEESANTTLSAVEASMPVVEGLQQGAGQLHGEWQKFRERQLTVDDFRSLTQELANFLDRVGSDSDELHGNLSEVLMAQGFQDLTGQIIRKVIALVQDVEDKLVHIIRLSGDFDPEAEKPPENDAKGHGPQVPGVDKDTGDVVHGQDEVDDLLSSLGF